MALIPEGASPLDEVWVALDLETTGLTPEDDKVIEVGAVKFRGDESIDTFQSYVNPGRRLSSFIKSFTGITQAQVDNAPSFPQVSRDLTLFLSRAPIVGHNLAFDAGFLESSGMRLTSLRADTYDLAYVLLPGASEYSLGKLAESFGIAHPNAHSALADARVTHEVFVRLSEMASELDVYTLAEMNRLASRSSWVLSYFLRNLESDRVQHSAASLTPDESQTGVMGFDRGALRGRLRHARALKANDKGTRVDPEEVASLLTSGGPLEDALDGFEERSEQIEMARSVARAISDGERLIVEAGTGVGKSLAYLLPAALYALRNNKRVVISTNTINLQEQLLRKDIPTLVDTLSRADGIDLDDFRYTQLKGRANYLCLKRWATLRGNESLSDDEARLLSKVLVWLRTTGTGDRSELNLGHRGAASPWDRMSAQGAQDCMGMNGVCFLRTARDRAAASHLVVVNHALLMSDLVAGRTLIPDYDVLIVDEAHHLEEEATRHLGFEASQPGFDDLVASLTGDNGLLNRVSVAFRSSKTADARRGAFEEVAATIAELLPVSRENLARMFGILDGLVGAGREYGNGQEVRVTGGTRSQPAWSDLEVEWENTDTSLSELHKALSSLNISVRPLEEAKVPDYDGLLMETVNAQQATADLRARLGEFIAHPNDDGIYWTSRARRTGDLILHAAPLHVGEDLQKLLFEPKHSVVLTSATLSTSGTFDHIVDRTGFDDAEQLLLGSPFDYPNAASLVVPRDMPEPQAWQYSEAIAQAVTDATLAAGGRTMALFTSHASLQDAASAVRGDLRARGFDVLAQGVDGTPHQLLRRFQDNPQSVLLGTASFWEGVDLPGETLKVLLLARLPFSVPTEPVFESRSELYDNPFMQYALPQAILRLRQGFGRLIRTKTDQGVVVILDRRIVSRRYGSSFIESLPNGITLRQPVLLDLRDEIKAWLARP